MSKVEKTVEGYIALSAATAELVQMQRRCYLSLPTSHPSEDARMARRQQNRAAQDWAIGRKILDRAEKSVT